MVQIEELDDTLVSLTCLQQLLINGNQLEDLVGLEGQSHSLTRLDAYGHGPWLATSVAPDSHSQFGAVLLLWLTWTGTITRLRTSGGSFMCPNYAAWVWRTTTSPTYHPLEKWYSC